MKRDADYSLYLVTDRGLMSAPSMESAVESAIRGGCTIVQLREKTSTSLDFFEKARSVKSVTDRLGVPLIINDRLDIALAVGADGVHVGQSDIPAYAARKAAGNDMILGVSASNLEEAKAAEAAGADYLGVGAMFATGTKTDAHLTSIEELAIIRSAISIPIVAIGGINARTAPMFRGTGIDGIAVVSAIIGAPDIESAAREMKCLFEREIKGWP
ncbi:MAG: thiamine phosphate synthase [Synergistaceae bacterium]|jgi:thiamine-phosphate pyrophosphorylase|nr:thiamine phosphate synthase [Synergistaceae bacterium]